MFQDGGGDNGIKNGRLGKLLAFTTIGSFFIVGYLKIEVGDT